MTTDWIYQRLTDLAGELTHTLSLMERHHERAEETRRQIGALRLRVRRLERRMGARPGLKDWAHLTISLAMLAGMAALLVMALTGALTKEVALAMLKAVTGS